ncbi:hypothetical protein DM47_2252 [Burkholderia mallei]|nr:hypothetical protein DM47_2252 [Burkholderia mallei]
MHRLRTAPSEIIPWQYSAAPRSSKRGDFADPPVSQNLCRMPVTATICVRVLDAPSSPLIHATAFDDAR